MEKRGKDAENLRIKQSLNTAEKGLHEAMTTFLLQVDL